MNFLSIVLVAAKRLWNNKGLVACSIAGLITAVALMTSIPLYTDAANFKVLKEQLNTGEGEMGRRVRPPFAFMYRYIGAWHEPVDLKDFEPVDEYISTTVPAIIGLPRKLLVRYVKTDNFSLFAASEAQYYGIREPLGWVNLGFIQGLREHIDILEGSFPRVPGPDDEVIEVLVSQKLAEETGLQVGEDYVVFQRPQTRAKAGDKKAEASKAIQFHVRIAGVWAPRDPQKDIFWFYNPSAFSNTFLISEEAFRARIAPAMDKEVYAAIWYLVFDGDRVRTDDVPGLIGRINYANTRVGTLLPNTTLDISPLKALQNYRWTTFVMTIVLYVFSIPILGLVLYFIGLISGLIVERQRGEIAILKSRGTGDFQVVGIYALEGLMVGSISLVAGIALGKQLALIMGNTISFLTFGHREPLPVLITPRAIRLGLLGVGIALLASLGPAMRAARLTIVTYKRERARALEKPVWQKYFLDFLLLIPSGYGYYILKNRGTINFLAGQAGGDPFKDPLLFLVPALTIFAVSLLIIRVFPLIMEALAWVSNQVVQSVSVVLALRQLARVSKQYTGALLLLILTLSLATFTASMARTLDRSLIDSTYYKYGADYLLVETGENVAVQQQMIQQMAGGGQNQQGQQKTPEEIAGAWVFVPVSEHLKVPGIRAATRVGSYTAVAAIGKERGRGQIYGIDRLDFPQVAFFRSDFAYSSLGDLMNRLAVDNSALLVSPNFLSDFSLNIGDRVELGVNIGGETRSMDFIIAGVLKYFPTYYPDEENAQYLFVANLDYIFEQMGGVFPYDVWIRTDPGVDPEKLQEQLADYDIHVVSMRGSREVIEREQARPERTGVFGILSVGFVAAAVLTVLGFLLHALISFRRRYIEFGVLRAIGLSVGQMIGFLGIEQLLLIATGITAGTALGVWVSDLFIPFLQVGTTEHFNVPPFVVLIAWDDIFKIYAVFAVMLVAAVAGMIWLLLHLKIFEAVKLGEAV
ncbi:MAG: FtsX-like permease family protein [Anaerolineae bacterium]|nr:FtsX-like permease family protein [Anaerolineae bacterium]